MISEKDAQHQSDGQYSGGESVLGYFEYPDDLVRQVVTVEFRSFFSFPHFFTEFC